MLLSQRMMVLVDHMADRHAEGTMPWIWELHILPEAAGGATLWTVLGVLSAAVVVLGAFIIYMRPGLARVWGILIALGAVVGVLCGTGGALAGVLGISAGVLAFIWEPQRPEIE
jgi:hypothetical protein